MKILHWIDENLEEALISIALAAIAIIMGVQVVLRYVFHNSLGWAEEICRYLFIWSAYLGFSYSTRRGLHLQLDIFPNLFPVLKKPFAYFADAVLFVFCIYMTGPGMSIISALEKSGQSSPAMRVPMKFVYLALLVGLILSIFRIVQRNTLMFMASRKTKKEDRKVTI